MAARTVDFSISGRRLAASERSVYSAMLLDVDGLSPSPFRWNGLFALSFSGLLVDRHNVVDAMLGGLADEPIIADVGC